MPLPRRRNRREQKDRTRERLHRAVERIGRKQGFLSLRTADVAEAAGVSHGAVFEHFPTRDDLLIAAVRRIGALLTDRLHATAVSGGSLREGLAGYLAVVREHESLYARLVSDIPHLPAAARRIWIGVMSAAGHHLSGPLESVRTVPRFRAVPTHLLLNTWIGLVHHYLVNRDLFVAKGSVIDQCGEQLIEHFCRLVSQ